MKSVQLHLYSLSLKLNVFQMIKLTRVKLYKNKQIASLHKHVIVNFSQVSAVMLW